MSGFIEEYLAGIAEHHEAAIRNLLDGERDVAQVREDFARAHAKARQFLEAGDEQGDGAARARLSRIRAGVLFIESYRTMPLLAWPRTLLDTLVDVDESLVLWRTGHARMVERSIGCRIGTGGTSGVDYLDRSTKYRIFPELWEVRTILLPEEYLPGLRHADRFRFLADHPESS